MTFLNRDGVVVNQAEHGEVKYMVFVLDGVETPKAGDCPALFDSFDDAINFMKSHRILSPIDYNYTVRVDNVVFVG